VRRSPTTSALSGLLLLRCGAPARSGRGRRLALGSRCPGPARGALGGGGHSGPTLLPQV